MFDKAPQILTLMLAPANDLQLQTGLFSIQNLKKIKSKLFDEMGNNKIFLVLYLNNIYLGIGKNHKPIGYEPADLTVHPPSPQYCRGWVYFFRVGV